MNCAHLRKESPFYDLFPLGMAPIVNVMVPSRVKLEGNDETEAYMLDWRKCTPEQQEAICERVVKLLGRGTPAEVREHAEKHGMPIRASQVSGTSTNLMWFL